MAAVIERVDRLEDLVAPSIGRIVRETLDQDVVDLSIRRKRKLGFFVLAIGDEVMEVENRLWFEPKRWR